MNPDPRPALPDRLAPASRLGPIGLRAAWRRVLAIGTCAALAAPASAAPAGGAVEPPEFVFERLGGTSLALILIAVGLVGLLVWRITVMVRREQAGPSSRRRAARSNGSSRAGNTDWGFDQNKRSAESRERIEQPVAAGGLASMEKAVTQWSVSEVHHAANLKVVSDDSLGKSPNAVSGPYETSFNPYFNREKPANGNDLVEVADALLQAELLVQLGDPKQAMTLLSNHIRTTEKPGPAVWLLLLSLYQSTGREAQYNALGSGFRMLFNAAVPPWATAAADLHRDLESYQPALERLQTAWPGKQAARAALDALLNDDRGGSRQGFSLTAYTELLFLSDVLEVLEAMAREDFETKQIQRKLGTPLPG